MSYITTKYHTLPDEILHRPKCPKLPNQSTTNRQRSGADEIITSTICSSHPTDHRRCNPHFTLSENKYVSSSIWVSNKRCPAQAQCILKNKTGFAVVLAFKEGLAGRKCAEMKRMRTIGKELKVELARTKMQPPSNRDCTQVHTMLSLNLDVDAAAAQVPTLTEMVGPSLIHHRLPPRVIIIVNLRFLLQGSYTHIPHDHIAYR